MEDNTVQIDIKSILGMILDNVVVIVAVTLIFAMMSFVFTKVCIPKKYSSSVSLYVMNNKATQNSGEILSSDISASQMLVNTYVVILSDNLVMENISDILIKKYGEQGLEGILPVLDNGKGKYIPSRSIASCISMGSVNETEVLQVKATTKDPQVSVDICLAMSEVAPEILSNIMGVAYVNPIGYPELPAGSSSPNMSKNVILGGILGFVLSTALVVLTKMLNNTIVDGESLGSRFGISVLGEIPSYEFSIEKDSSKGEVKPSV